MKKLIAMLMAVALLCACAAAEGVLTVTNMSLIEITDSVNGWFFARVENTGDAPVGVDSGTLTMKNADGEVILVDEWIYTSPGMMLLQPGEYTYMTGFLWEDILQEQDIADYTFEVRPAENGDTYQTLDSFVNLVADEWHDTCAWVTFTNTTDRIVYDAYAVIAMLDENGAVIATGEWGTGDTGIYPGSTIAVKIYLNDELMNKLNEDGRKVATVDSIVYCMAK